MAESDADDDPVVHEVDVFLSKALAQKLYLFQYPVRPANMTYDGTPNLAARAKLQQKKVELELSMDTSSDMYCQSRGEQVAQSVNATAKDGEQGYYHSSVMDKQTLTSVRATEDTSKFVAGLLKEDSLHLTPIHGAVQLRPGFGYLDKVDDFSKKQQTDKDTDSQEEEEEARPVMLKFSKGVEDKTKQRRLKSFNHLEEVEAAEPWISFHYHQPYSQQAFSEKMLMFCHQQDFESPEFITTSREYLKMLSPALENKINRTAAMPDGMLSLTQLQGMDLLDKIKLLMINAKVMQFSQLSGLVGSGIDDKILLRGICQYASLVQGCWVVKSDILYPKGSKTLVTGMDAEKLWPARDYVMWCFNMKSLISRKDISCIVKVPHDELKDVLEQFSRQRARGWEFVLPADVEFLERFGDIVKMQIALWRRRYLSLQDHFDIPKDPADDGHVIAGLDFVTCKMAQRKHNPKHLVGKGDDEREPVRHRRRNRSISSDTKNNVMNSQSSTNSVKERSSRAKVKHEQGVEIKQENPETLANRLSPDLQDDVDIVETVICDDEGTDDVVMETVDDDRMLDLAFVPPPVCSTDTLDQEDEPPSDIYLKELQSFVKNTIKGGCMSLHELQEVLALHRQDPTNVLRCAVSDEVLETNVRKTGAEQLQIKWPSEVPYAKRIVFFYPKIENVTDKFRPALGKLFSNNFAVRRKDVMNACSEEAGATPSSHVYQKLMDELCERYNARYYLRGTYKAVNPTD